ncbi:hypothetical protein POJ06DRAFT_45004 [Lipomyces tetrasporus]|uniref:RRM domain-containing protein n=1 Tax=Lipomyces tetrasporus TaxID=54092 RepID=A0AAD7QKB6_9ASCO|nr:uncharacterized protein POJ06DRAFT_45004 [Lipomyces tetrasporus]KAJ8096838.1 hypothetical protein POJ06DRAFT_45004 [Lipomyces tetrasporus]
MSDTEMQYVPASESPSPEPGDATAGENKAQTVAPDTSLEEKIQVRIRDVEQQSLKSFAAAGGVSTRTNRPVPPPPPPPGLLPSQVSKKIESRLGAYGNPSQTLYVNNLNDKIRKQELRLCLYTLFATYGRVIDVVAVKTKKMRGQAHIVFSDVPSATQALRSLQGVTFLGKELHIEFAKSKSNSVAKLDGTYRLPPPPALNASTLPEYTDVAKGVKRLRADDSDDDE